jgi:hypothetical protein
MKPFIAHLLETDETYEYKLVSVDNIHTDEVMGKIRLALGKHGLISVEPNGVQLNVKDKNVAKFSEYPFAPVYFSKVIMSSPISSIPAIQSISLFTRINNSKMKFFDKNDKVVMDGADAEQHAHPIEVDSKGSQDEVGQSHADSLVSDLMKNIASSRENNVIRPVYEGSVASHKEVTEMLNKSVPRGFYLIENESRGSGTVMGPFRKCPDNYGYIKTVSKAVVLTEKENDGVIEYSVQYPETDMQKDPEDAGSRDRNKPMTVKLVDQDTGKEHSIVVRADNDDTARIRAVEIIANRTGFHKDRFIPMNPTSA